MMKEHARKSLKKIARILQEQYVLDGSEASRKVYVLVARLHNEITDDKVTGGNNARNKNGGV